MKFTLRQIQVFVAVVHHGSTMAASQALNISQPAVSSALSEFESNFGSKLFYRWKKGMVLNEIGRSIIDGARLILANARDLDNFMGVDKTQLCGTLQLGASTTPANYIVPKILCSFVTEHPSVKVEVSCRNKSTIIDAVENFAMDVGVIAGSCNRPDINCSQWIDDELCIFSESHHPLVQKAHLTLDDLASHTWIMREEGSGTREGFLNSLPNEIKPLNIMMEFDSLEAIKKAVEHSQALGCISRTAIEREVQAGILSILPTPSLKLRRQYSILLHKQRSQSTLLNYFIGYCLHDSD